MGFSHHADDGSGNWTFDQSRSNLTTSKIYDKRASKSIKDKIKVLIKQRLSNQQSTRKVNIRKESNQAKI